MADVLAALHGRGRSEHVSPSRRTRLDHLDRVAALRQLGAGEDLDAALARERACERARRRATPPTTCRRPPRPARLALASAKPSIMLFSKGGRSTSETARGPRGSARARAARAALSRRARRGDAREDARERFARGQHRRLHRGAECSPGPSLPRTGDPLTTSLRRRWHRITTSSAELLACCALDPCQSHDPRPSEAQAPPPAPPPTGSPRVRTSRARSRPITRTSRARCSPRRWRRWRSWASSASR